MTTRRMTSQARERVLKLIVIAGGLDVVAWLYRYRRRCRTGARGVDPGRIVRNSAFYPPHRFSERRGSSSGARRAVRTFIQREHAPRNNQSIAPTFRTIHGKPGSYICHMRMSAQRNNSVLSAWRAHLHNNRTGSPLAPKGVPTSLEATCARNPQTAKKIREGQEREGKRREERMGWQYLER